MPSDPVGKLGPPKGVCAGRGKECGSWLRGHKARAGKTEGGAGGGGGKQSLWVEGYFGLALVVVAFLYAPPPATASNPGYHHHHFLKTCNMF